MFERPFLNGAGAPARALLRLGAAVPLLALLTPTQAHAQEVPAGAVPVTIAPAGSANINLTPRRVIFTEAKRTEAIYVFNQGNKIATVEVTLVDNVMLPTGEIIPVSQAEGRDDVARASVARLRSARDLVVATPRRLVLEPGKGKTIRLRSTIPEGAAGATEYRTHLTVTTLPDADTGLTAEDAARDVQSGELSMRVQSIFGISIPLIVRGGQHDTAAALDGFRLLGTRNGEDKPVLQATLSRTGTGSLYGNLEVRSGTGKSGEVIGFIRGVGLYPEIAARQVNITLTRAPKPGELLAITFTSDEGGASGPAATAQFRAD